MRIDRKEDKHGRLWIVSTDRGKVVLVIDDDFLHHEMNRTGTNADDTIKHVFGYSFRLQNILDAIDL